MFEPIHARLNILQAFKLREGCTRFTFLSSTAN